MEPQIRYAKTADAVNIAYKTIGNGPPIVWLPDIPFSHLGLDQRHAHIHDTSERISQDMMLVRYDARGSGMSDRRVEDMSLDGLLLDIDAVVAALSIESFVLVGVHNGGLLAAAYASRYPTRVSHLCLVSPYARVTDYLASPRLQAVSGMLATDWELFTETVGALIFGFRNEKALGYGDFIRACVSQESLTQLVAQLSAADLTEELRRIRARTLVVYMSEFQLVSIELVRDCASRIPNVQLTVEEASVISTATAETILAFIREDLGLKRPLIGVALRTVLFTDIVGHTEMMSRLGDTAGRDVLREHERITRETLRAHGGDEVKSMGDGFMASFGSVTAAVECAISLQRAIQDLAPKLEAGSLKLDDGARPPASSVQPPASLQVRVGLNAGEPIAEDGDLFGATVILASRICAQAGAGEILIPEPVRHLLAGKGFAFADRGEFVPKGFDDAVRVFEVRWRE